jgi:hypothetical protein
VNELKLFALRTEIWFLIDVTAKLTPLGLPIPFQQIANTKGHCGVKANSKLLSRHSRLSLKEAKGAFIKPSTSVLLRLGFVSLSKVEGTVK